MRIAPLTLHAVAQAAASMALLGLHAVAWSQAAVVPDAGQTLRQMQRPAEPPRGQAAITQIPAEADIGADGGLRVPVTRVRLEGVRSVPLDEVQRLVGELAGTSPTLADLRRAAARVTAYYRARGYLVARAHVPAQTIKDGEVLIQVLEGVADATSLDNRSVVHNTVMQGVLDWQGLVGQVLRAEPVDRTLLLLADLPAVGRVEGVLRPGATVGSSSLHVSAAAGERHDGAVVADNHGNRYTGQYRLSGKANFNSPRELGDRLSVSTTVSQHRLFYARAAYDQPLNGDGLRGGVQVSHSSYHLAEEFNALDASGRVSTLGVMASWPALRSAKRNLWLHTSLDERAMADDTGSTATQARKRSTVWAGEAFGDLVSQEGAGAYSTAKLGIDVGHMRLRDAGSSALDAAGPQTAGTFAKLGLQGSRVQALDATNDLYATATAQWASKNLDSSEKFGIGGVHGVRAYPQGEASGDQGWLFSAEWRWRFAPGWRASAFYDAGGVTISKRPQTGTDNSHTLRGLGAGLNVERSGWSVQTALAWRDGAAARSAPDRNPRLWIAAGMHF